MGKRSRSAVIVRDFEEGKIKRLCELRDHLQPFVSQGALDHPGITSSMQIKIYGQTKDEHTVMSNYFNSQLKAIQNVKMRAKETQDLKIYKKEQAIQRAQNVKFALQVAQERKANEAAAKQEPISAFQYKSSSESEDDRKKIVIVKDK